MLAFAPKFLGQAHINLGQTKGVATARMAQVQKSPSLGYVVSSELAKTWLSVFDRMQQSLDTLNQLVGSPYTNSSLAGIQDNISAGGEAYAAVSAGVEQNPTGTFPGELNDELTKLVDLVNDSIDRLTQAIYGDRRSDAFIFEQYSSFKAAAQDDRLKGNTAGAAANTASAQQQMHALQITDAQIYQESQLLESWIVPFENSQKADIRKSTITPNPSSKYKTVMAGRSLGQAAAPGVECRSTPEGGKVCSDGTYFAPGSNVPILAAPPPSRFQTLPALGIAAAVIGIGIGTYLFLKK